MLKVCPCHQAMTHPRFTDGRDDHEVWGVHGMLPCTQYFLCDWVREWVALWFSGYNWLSSFWSRLWRRSNIFCCLDTLFSFGYHLRPKKQWNLSMEYSGTPRWQHSGRLTKRLFWSKNKEMRKEERLWSSAWILELPIMWQALGFIEQTKRVVLQIGNWHVS